MDKHPHCRTVFQLANKQQTADCRRLFDSNITVKGMNPAFVGPYLFEAVEENHMYKVPHMHTHEQIRARHRRIESDLEREEKLHEKYAPLQKYCSDSFLFAAPQKPRRFSGGAFAISVLFLSLLTAPAA